MKVERAAEWAREFDPAIEVRAIQAELASADDVRKIVDSARPDAVSAGVDHPGEIDTWVNAACVRAGVPFCRAGMSVTEGIVWSVEPGSSACLACNDGQRPDAGPEFWMIKNIASLSLHQPAFWESVIVAAVTAAGILVPVPLAIRERRLRRSGVLS